MTARRYFSLRMSQAGYDAVKALADAEMGGNVSEMARLLLSEALQARATRRNTVKPRRAG